MPQPNNKIKVPDKVPLPGDYIGESDGAWCARADLSEVLNDISGTLGELGHTVANIPRIPLRPCLKAGRELRRILADLQSIDRELSLAKELHKGRGT